MKRKIFYNLFTLSLLTTVLTCALLSAAVYKKHYDGLKAELRKEAALMAAALESNGTELLSRLATDAGSTRVTYIKADGTVLFDSRSDASGMENHASRPEVSAALQNGSGQASRQSGTLGKQTYYYALRLTNGDVLRAAFDISGVFASVLTLVPYIILTAFVLIIIASALAKKQTENIISPINSLNLEKPLENDVYDEFSPLLIRLEKQDREIRLKIDELSSLQKEFKAVTDDMREGLLVIGSDGNILSANNSAKSIFVAEHQTGELSHYLTFNRGLAFKNTIDAALSGRSAQARMVLAGRTYRLSASPASLGERGGAVVLIEDETEKALSEQIRREFSANVSHELKTPLTSILASSEIIMNKIVKPEDISHFAEGIHNEAERLLSLIDDIIKLSRLDESTAEAGDEGFSTQEVDLYAICGETLENLRSLADSRGVTLRLSGGPCNVTGIKRLLYEIVYNLCDNAVKYNRPGGSVEVSVEEIDDTVILSVADTGIGIGEDDRQRVFERFYRADKSRQSGTGGTGLGLSIVKYAAKLHGAQITLKSREGEGSVFSLIFPV